MLLAHMSVHKKGTLRTTRGPIQEAKILGRFLGKLIQFARAYLTCVL